MLPPNTVLQNRYRIIRQLGKGGMGTVYQALDQRLDAVVALKECHFTDSRLKKQFEREARLLARLRHPAMTKVIDHFSEDDGQFLVMEFIPGDDLFGMIEAGSIPFPPGEVLKWADQLLDALDYLHTQDPPIIHRDIKPQNLKLTGRGQIILLDFGLAKGFAGEISRVTESGSIFGYTPNYAPLEQIQGTGTDARSDLYSLAATLYQLMTGVTPPDALARITAVANERPDPLRPANELNRLIPQEIAEVLTKAMMQNSEKRPANAAEMRKTLHQASQALVRTAPSQADTLLQNPPADRPPVRQGEGSQEDTTLLLTAPSGAMPAVSPAKAAGRPNLFFRFTRSPNRWTWTIGASLALLLIGIVVPVLLMKSILPASVAGDGSPLGRPLRVGIVSWPGYAGGIVANNGFKPNKECIFFKNHKQTVEFFLLEDPAQRSQAFAKGEGGVDIVWSSVDYWANELPGFISNGVKARAIMQVDWSRGADAIVADASIKSIEDLKGKKISLVKYTPSHWLLEYALENSALSDSDQKEIIDNLVGKDATLDARQAFKDKQVDATVVWEPDVTLALERPGSRILVSTETVKNLIADVMVAREDFIKEHPDVIKAFIQGWLDGTTEAVRNPDKVAQLLMENEPLYGDMKDPTKVRDSLKTVKYADLADNTKMFGLDGSNPLFDQLYTAAGRAWVKRGYISQLIPPAQAEDDSFLKEIYALSPVPTSQEPLSGSKRIEYANVEFARALQASDEVEAVAFSPDGSLISGGSKNGVIRVWETSTGELKREIPKSSDTSSLSEVTSLVFSPDGKMLAAGRADATVAIWDPQTGDRLNVLRGHSARVNSVAVSPDGKTLASGADDATVKLWQLGSIWSQPKSLSLDAPVRAVAFSSDGAIVAGAGGSQHGRLRMWDVTSGALKLPEITKSGVITTVSFSKDGRLAAGTVDATVAVWNVQSRDQLTTLRGHKSQVNGLVFSPFGETIVSGSADTYVLLWDADVYGPSKRALTQNTGPVYAVAVSSDGKMIASGGADKTVRLWVNKG